MNELKKIIKILIREIEEHDNILNISGATGYGVGKARAKDYHGVSKNLGDEEIEKQAEYEIKPVSISKAFRRRNDVN